MSHRNKVNVKKKAAYLFVCAVLILTFFKSSDTFAQQPKPIANKIDTAAKSLNDTVPVVDTLKLKKSKSELEAPVAYKAEDSIIIDVPNKRMYMYGKESRVVYQDNDLSAPLITYDSKTNLVKAMRTTDSLGNTTAFPMFKQGPDFTSQMDTIIFNMPTQKGLTKGTYTKQGEMYVYGETIKKVDSITIYGKGARFTTCDLDTPHFAFKAEKVKFVSKEWAYSGPIHPEFEGVPVPIVLPFGIFPLKQGRHSGLLSPNIGSNSQYGLSLENLGYYKVVNDYWDMILYGSIYSYGGYAFKLNPNYYKRYKYRGNMDISYLSTKLLDEPRTNSYSVKWMHNADMKARPGQNFMASVDISSSKYNSRLPNSPMVNVQNQMGSTIMYGKNWKNKPYSFSLSSRHTQNNNLGLYNVELPNAMFNMSTIYPLRGKERVGELKWYENLGIGITTNASNSTTFYDTTGGKPVGKQMVDNMRYGVSHNVPIILSLPQLGPVNITPGMSYQENWYQQKLIRKWNPDINRIDTLSLQKGFYTARDMSFNLNIATRIFGMFGFGKTSKVVAMRHQMTPTVGISYKPDLNKNNRYLLQTDAAGRMSEASYYEGNIKSAFYGKEAATMSFSLGNNLAMKVRSNKDTANGGLKKVTIFETFNFTTSYNIIADSFKLNPIYFSGNSNLFEKVNITFGGTFSPYGKDSVGHKIDKLIWAQKPLSLGYLNNANISLSTSFRGGEKKKKNAGNETANRYDENGYPLTDYQLEALYMQNNPGLYSDFEIPWDVSLSYSFIYSNPVYRNWGSTYTGQKNISQNATVRASANISPKWKIGANGSYNFDTHKFGYVSMFMSRDMHCWQMAINIAPVGIYKFFNITIQPKSPVLRDLKVNRTRSFFDRP